MELSDLRIFLSVAREQSVTRAAKALDRVPSNVSTRIQQLEDSLGAALFTRDSKRMLLSDAGQTLAGYACRLLDLAAEAEQAVRVAEPGGCLRLGSMESTAASRLPQPLARLHARHPGIDLQLRTGTTRALADAVASHALDCAIVAHPYPQRSDDVGALGVGLQGHYLFTEDLLLVLPPGGGQPQALAAFARGCVYRERAEQWLREAGSDPGRLQIMELASYHAMLACVMAGSAMAVLPQSVLALHAFALPTRAIGPAHCFLIRRQGHASANYQALLAALRD
ncbi:LysR family transcriptional regulator [Bordetella holmesii]|uniref:LysR substrate-binding domain protein n=2 Tax=Bordetella holmesii TaxID=35814 RepID=A0A158M146_9BORD|nr:LysR family transcriptional regulator [Bordetella holmesii]AHV93241.1 bacterial regulatory helix-turn-helix, lysR family protein [Bordetella holmesii ATCC 51541]AIT25516.1 bacterial regulatory helix-turn-helix, lysR family protein [Bordetella holmesii 44057]EWM43477.1 bacterial regulatory helix-turn-helix, lysR family protein [Bordetella holmesii 41130]EWM46084.1 bacterial regulatory helix-turn-helix, lysR family protein [Bordetella holmesii 35009]EWM50234.1 bacterial regulatory helix-turn-